MPFQPPPQEAFIERIRSRIVEGRKLSPYDYESVVIPLYAVLDETGGAYGPRGGAQFILPSEKRFRLQQVLPIVVLDTISNEVLTNGGVFVYDGAGPTLAIQGGDLFDRMYAKAQNCVIDMKFDSQEMQLNINASFRLSDLLDGNGVDFFDTPTTFPADTSIDLFASLQDDSAAACGSPTQYGVLLIGQLVRV